MKILKKVIVSWSVLLISLTTYPQDFRTFETRIADLLARMPANDLQLTEILMENMLSLGQEGIQRICDQVIPAGTGDDTPQRFAVESLSRYLSQPGKDIEKTMWEKICIHNVLSARNYNVRDFFFKQLQMIGGEQSINALTGFLTDKENCNSALQAINAIDGNGAETALIESLKNKDLPCSAEVMNTLASMKSKAAVSEYIAWVSHTNINVKASAYNALAQSATSQAYRILSKAAKDISYGWEPSGVTASLLNYAQEKGMEGDLRSANKICRVIIRKGDDMTNMHNKIAALNIYTSFNGEQAMRLIIRAARHEDKEYRVAAMRKSLEIPGSDITERWVDLFRRASPMAKPEIITMLGERGDIRALELVSESLSNSDSIVRIESAAAIVKINGDKAIGDLIKYMTEFPEWYDQQAAKLALSTVLGHDNIHSLLPVLKEGPPAAKSSVIELLAWSSASGYFDEVLSYTSSSDQTVKIAAYAALANLASAEDQSKLIELLSSTDEPVLVTNVQAAIIRAAGAMTNPGKRSDVILDALAGGARKEKLIPVLARTGGRDALKIVLDEFERGTPETREIYFTTLTNWIDHSASTALFEICISGNKTYEAPAFAGFVRLIRESELPDEQKLLLYRKILPCARSKERKNELLIEIGKLRTYQSLFFVADYLDDPETSSTAARSAMNIALPSEDLETGMYGTIVKEILLKAVSRLKGQESDYNREMLNKYIASMPQDEGFKSMFNGKDLTGWQGLVENPIERAIMKPAELAKRQIEASKKVPANWSVKDGSIWFSGSGDNLCSIEEYGDFEMLVDWKISKGGDSGIYLRGTPQVQIWDTSRTEVGAQVGSGGLYNNQIHPSQPIKVADNPVGDWNTFRILMTGENVSVWLNGELVVDNVVMENYWDRTRPIFPEGPVELQAHGTDLAFRDIFIREISEDEYNLTPQEKEEGFIALFNGRNLDNWIGNKESYIAENGEIVVKPLEGSGGNLYTEKEYSDFIFRFEFLLTPGANNGLGIRTPITGDAAYVGMELQILDDTAPVYANLEPYQYHGSVYGVIPAKRGYLKPVGEWNFQEVEVRGTRIKITLNGTVIVDGDIAGPRDKGTMDKNDHPGLHNESGHIGFLGHGSELKFRNIRIKDLSQSP